MTANTCRSYFHKLRSSYIIHYHSYLKTTLYFYKPLVCQMFLPFHCSAFKQYYLKMSVSTGLSELGWCYFSTLKVQILLKIASNTEVSEKKYVVYEIISSSKGFMAIRYSQHVLSFSWVQGKWMADFSCKSILIMWSVNEYRITAKERSNMMSLDLSFRSCFSVKIPFVQLL